MTTPTSRMCVKCGTATDRAPDVLCAACYEIAIGPMLRAVQDMWAAHETRAPGVCGCTACKTGRAFFEACFEVGEARR